MATVDEDTVDATADTKPLSLTIGPDDEDDHDMDGEVLSESFMQWQLQAGPSHISPGGFINEEMQAAPSDSDINDLLKGLLADGRPIFQPMNDGFVDELFVKKGPKMLGGYLFGDALGEGSYAKVKECLEERTLVRRAVKIIKHSRLRKIMNGQANVAREMRILRRMRHVNVIKLIDVFRNDEKQKLYMVFEYCVGSLQQMLDAAPDKRFPEFQSHEYFAQLINGLEYLHSQGVIHKDIKPGNLLLALDETLKISDMGVAEELDQFSTEDWCQHGQGTPKFQSPEVAAGLLNQFHGRPVDVWACGVTLYNFVSGEYPFDGDVIMRLYENICHQPLQMPKTIDLKASLCELLTSMLHKNPAERATIASIKASAWLRRKLTAVGSRVAVPVCNNAPAHRPLSVYGPLHEMFDEGADDHLTFVNDNHHHDAALAAATIECPPAAASLTALNQPPIAIRPPKRNRSLCVVS
uniref:non-specific serine/threonine protein kinase n=1 Tax=Plectus sambesii TaxID=2011161 RepID=A0A914X0Z0_9BILA